MIQVSFIKENREKVVHGLAKRNFPDAEVTLDKVLAADETRKATQTKLDNTLAESNKISKEIGILFKAGEPQKAALLKEKTALLKFSKDHYRKRGTGRPTKKERRDIDNYQDDTINE